MKKRAHILHNFDIGQAYVLGCVRMVEEVCQKTGDFETGKYGESSFPRETKRAKIKMGGKKTRHRTVFQAIETRFQSNAAEDASRLQESLVIDLLKTQRKFSDETADDADWQRSLVVVTRHSAGDVGDNSDNAQRIYEAKAA